MKRKYNREVKIIFSKKERKILTEILRCIDTDMVSSSCKFISEDEVYRFVIKLLAIVEE